MAIETPNSRANTLVRRSGGFGACALMALLAVGGCSSRPIAPAEHVFRLSYKCATVDAHPNWNSEPHGCADYDQTQWPRFWFHDVHDTQKNDVFRGPGLIWRVMVDDDSPNDRVMTEQTQGQKFFDDNYWPANLRGVEIEHTAYLGTIDLSPDCGYRTAPAPQCNGRSASFNLGFRGSTVKFTLQSQFLGFADFDTLSAYPNKGWKFGNDLAVTSASPLSPCSDPDPHLLYLCGPDFKVEVVVGYYGTLALGQMKNDPMEAFSPEEDTIFPKQQPASIMIRFVDQRAPKKH